jgi:hypothetical protein
MPKVRLIVWFVMGLAFCVHVSPAQRNINPLQDRLEPVAQQNPNVASPACVACRDNCVNRREQCKNLACTHAGGKNKGPQCDTQNNPNWDGQRFQNELKACTDQEIACKNQCQAGACR